MIFNYSDNKDTIDKIAIIENYILNLIASNKNKIFKITELLSNGFIKYCSNEINNNVYFNNMHDNKSLILKISGLWETKENIGVTFKIILIEDIISPLDISTSLSNVCVTACTLTALSPLDLTSRTLFQESMLATA